MIVVPAVAEREQCKPAHVRRLVRAARRKRSRPTAESAMAHRADGEDPVPAARDRHDETPQGSLRAAARIERANEREPGHKVQPIQETQLRVLAPRARVRLKRRIVLRRGPVPTTMSPERRPGDRAVRIALRVRVLVVVVVMAAPPDGAALEGEAANRRERELRRTGCLV